MSKPNENDVRKVIDREEAMELIRLGTDGGPGLEDEEIIDTPAIESTAN